LIAAEFSSTFESPPACTPRAFFMGGLIAKPAKMSAMSTEPKPPGEPARAQPRNPLHGITLQRMVEELAEHFGWQELGEHIPIRCFTFEPSVSSSLRFLRKTPWAREKVEGLYLFMLRDIRRQTR
jgi:hypothetical protein